VLIIRAEDEVSQNLDSNATALTALQKKEQAYRGVDDGLTRLRISILAEPESLSSYERLLESRRNSGTLYLDECPADLDPTAEEWRHCKMIANVEAHMYGTLNTIESINASLNVLVEGEDLESYVREENGIRSFPENFVREHPEVALYFSMNIERLTGAVRDLYSNFAIIVSQYPSMADSPGDRLNATRDMDRAVYRFFKQSVDLYADSDYYSDIIAEELANLTSTKVLLESKMQELEVQKNATASRISDVQFPFGKIPVGLREAIALFPILIAAGAMVCSTYLIRTISARKRYHKYVAKDNRKKHAVKEDVFLLAPLWIEPYECLSYRVIKFMVLLIPAAGFGLSVFLIFSQGLLLNTFPQTSDVTGDIYLAIYGTVYAIGICFFAWSYYAIRKGYHEYTEYYFAA
jgi:hypothetical protein